MQTIDTRKKIAPSGLAAAANQDFVDLSPRESQAARTPAGWDPYEVWLRMIKQPRERRGEPSAR